MTKINKYDRYQIDDTLFSMLQTELFGVIITWWWWCSKKYMYTIYAIAPIDFFFFNLRELSRIHHTSSGWWYEHLFTLWNIIIFLSAWWGDGTSNTWEREREKEKERERERRGNHFDNLSYKITLTNITIRFYLKYVTIIYIIYRAFMLLF